MALLESEKEILERLDRIEKLLLQLFDSKFINNCKPLSANKACKLLGIGYDTFLDLVNDGIINANKRNTKSGGIRYEVDPAEIEKYIKRDIKQKPIIKNDSSVSSGKQIWEEIQKKKRNRSL